LLIFELSLSLIPALLLVPEEGSGDHPIRDRHRAVPVCTEKDLITFFKILPSGSMTNQVPDRGRQVPYTDLISQQQAGDAERGQKKKCASTFDLSLT